MAICVDFLVLQYPKSKQVARCGNLWCHLFEDAGDVEALHEFAIAIGLKKKYFQSHRFLPHYDLTPTLRARALKAGAIEKSSAEIVRKARLENRNA
ncbi:MAG: DUF4031 domain-containing protein [Richelia sp. CSU_2_1]|nr:DUF4031 domain-containing protein [Microcoleus sp. SU_5_6]NJR24516.1 DUF4031 domain-containing protein [Richelia sp. CSU_2_1]